MICPNCGNIIDSSETFCKYCGTHISNNIQKENKNNILIIIGSVLLIVLFFFLSYLYFLKPLFNKQISNKNENLNIIKENSINSQDKTNNITDIDEFNNTTKNEIINNIKNEENVENSESERENNNGEKIYLSHPQKGGLYFEIKDEKYFVNDKETTKEIFEQLKSYINNPSITENLLFAFVSGYKANDNGVYYYMYKDGSIKDYIKFNIGDETIKVLNLVDDTSIDILQKTIDADPTQPIDIYFHQKLTEKDKLEYLQLLSIYVDNTKDIRNSKIKGFVLQPTNEEIMKKYEKVYFYEDLYWRCSEKEIESIFGKPVKTEIDGFMKMNYYENDDCLFILYISDDKLEGFLCSQK